MRLLLLPIILSQMVDTKYYDMLHKDATVHTVGILDYISYAFLWASYLNKGK